MSIQIIRSLKYKYNNRLKTKIILPKIKRSTSQAGRNPLTSFFDPWLFKYFLTRRNDKLSQVMRLKIQKMKVTNSPESDEIGFDL